MQADKRCVRCGDTKGAADFYPDKAKRDGLSSYCRDCRKAKSREWGRANRERANERSREYRRRNPDRARKADREQRERHGEKRRAYDRRYMAARFEEMKLRGETQKRNPQKMREAGRLWRQANKLKRTQNEALRRSHKRATSSERVDYALVLESHGATCHICGLTIDPGLTSPHPLSLSFDHVIPLARGGAHSYENVRPAHLTCNIAKGSRVA